MFDIEILKKKIENRLEGSTVELQNPRGDGEHFLVNVTWSGFKEMKLIEQHRKVYDALDEEFKKGLHSISLKTKTQ